MPASGSTAATAPADLRGSSNRSAERRRGRTGVEPARLGWRHADAGPDATRTLNRFLRQTSDGDEQRTTALSSLRSRLRLRDHSALAPPRRASRSSRAPRRPLFLLLVVWWAWIYTTWMTNWFDPDAIAVRARADPRGARKSPHGGSDSRRLRRTGGDVRRKLYAGLQVVRNAFAAFASPSREPSTARTSCGSCSGRSASASCGWPGRSDPTRPRIAVWLVALVARLRRALCRLLGAVSRARGHRRHGRSRRRTSPSGSSSSSSSPSASRSSSPALTASELDLDAATVGCDRGRVSRIGGSLVALLRLRGADRSAAPRPLSDDPGRLARDAYTYIHIPIIAGVIVTAVGDELVIAHLIQRLDAARAGGGGRRTGALPDRPRRVPLAHDRNAQRQAPLVAAVACMRCGRARPLDGCDLGRDRGARDLP